MNIHFLLFCCRTEPGYNFPAFEKFFELCKQEIGVEMLRDIWALSK